MSEQKRGGFLAYKCRRCGDRIEQCHAPELDLALICLTSNNPLPKEWFGVSPGMTGLHYCSRIHVGITDLIGGTLDG